jgi:hypothetical protein
VRHIGVKDSFFDVRGDSMLAGLVVNRCQEAFGVRINAPLLLGGEGTIEHLSVAIVAALAGDQTEGDTAVDAMIDDVVRDSTYLTESTAT